jgi:transposase
MAFREVTMLEIKEVLLLWLAGRKTKPIAASVGLDAKTVRRYIRAAEAQGLARGSGEVALSEELLLRVLVALKGQAPRPPSEGWQACEAHREQIAGWLRNKVRLTKAQRLLKRQGVEVTYATLYRFSVAELGFGRTAPTLPVVDGKPGEELQMDVGKMTLVTSDERRWTAKAFIFTPCVSRRRFVFLSLHEGTEDAIAACEAAWGFYGGVFGVLLVDNAKCIVTEADPLGARVNETFLEYAQSRGFHIDTTRVRDPKGKARVERSVRDVRDDGFGGEVLDDIEAAQRRAGTWCEEYGTRRHSSTGRLPKEHFLAEEAPCLKPAPTELYDVPLWCEPKVARDHFAQVAKSLYSLPTKYIGKRLKARADSRTVRFYDGGVLVKTHPRALRGKRSTDANDFPEHKRPYAMRDVNFLRAQATEHGASVGLLAERLLEGPLPWTRMRQVYALVGLVRKYGAKRVDDACGRALRESMHNVRRLERMLALAAQPAEPREARVIPIARYLRPNQQYALSPKPERKP